MTIDSTVPAIAREVNDTGSSIRIQAANRDIIQAVRAVNASDKLGDKNELSFSLDPRTHRPVVKIVNRDTKEVIEQIPNEQVLRLAEGL
jgi:flagellar protein FlaG